jgi:hypothetical protein
LRAIAPQLLKNFTAVASELAGVRDYLATIFLAPPRLNIEPFALDTGPPPSLSFAESILQRSILAHAPPTGFTLS